VSPSKDSDKEIEYGIELLTVFSVIDRRVERGQITEEQAAKHRKEVCQEMRSLLWKIKPWWSHYNKYWNRQNQARNKGYGYSGTRP